ncbi:putative transcriptional regulator, Crp/Fnr family [Caenispirillum salinarum AK4]|uniref:Putative transcriptional regulator, Crp/Fnr family n=1 Tax=Caenispirillum salinarum AK4 TaxID=1238182 RepID=K9GQL3_9PROT|nr:Crp/Fnr family transcriptional regulator [Caenispirillum salinarum]EKV27024.1 putative transcriptional regulator, Crp/Fnr family [Caenispirillum salinarum AK4]
MPIDIACLSDAAVAAAAQRRLEPLGRVRPVARDAVLCRAGDPVDTLFMVRSGRFIGLLPLAGADGPVPVEEATAGAVVGLGDWLAGAPHAATVIAVAAGEVLEVPAATLRARAAAEPDMALLLVGLLSNALRRCIAATDALRRGGVRDRTVAYLLSLPVQRAPDGGGESVRLPMSKKLVAAHLGMTQQSFSRVLKRLRDDGVVIQGRRVTIADRARLAGSTLT